MDEIDAAPCEREVWRAGRYRDVLVLAIVASRAIRRRNLCAVEIGRLFKDAGLDILDV